MRLRDKIHNYLQEKALDKAILDLVGPWWKWNINIVDNKVYFNFKETNFKLLENFELILPSCDEIKKQAKKKYKKFDDNFIKDIVYRIKFPMWGEFCDKCRNLILTAKDSDILLGSNDSKKIDIRSKGLVRIQGYLSSSDININAKTIELYQANNLYGNSINLNAEFVEFNRTYTTSKNLNINSSLLSFDNSEIMCSKNINIKSDMIETKNTSLKAKNKIEINNTNCDEIKEVDAPIIRYNGQDISYSESIIKPKLMGNLIEVLKEIRSKTYSMIENQVKIETQKYKQDLENSLNNKSITKILKK